MGFGDRKTPIYGSYGEFNIQNGSSSLRVNYVQTKMKPGSGGWESDLASKMVPWRELFNLEEMTFDELLQRDLDDSRVAHDLIPYLLGDEGHKAKFFPPILAVMVPMRPDKSGIENYYPDIMEDDSRISSGDLFAFSPVDIEGEKSPLGLLEYDRQNTSFVIVDGQHRAMAVLALHRQLNKSWQGNRYESYYSHIDVKPGDIGHVELPVCILYFPDLFQGNKPVVDQGIDLKGICRDIFLVVNKHAKRVSATRELLLDDDDFCARMMRGTLSKLKSRGETNSSLSRIYCFSYGDDDDEGKVLKGQEYSSASFIHKFHAAISFGQVNSLKLVDTSEVTDGRRTQNSTRPPELLRGTDFQLLNSLSRYSAKSHSPDDVERIVQYLQRLVDVPLFELYDAFRPFAVYNAALRSKRHALSQPEMKAQAIQAKTYALMFEGSGARNVFVDHRERLEGIREEYLEKGTPVPSYIDAQLTFTKSVLTAFDNNLLAVQEEFACRFLGLDEEKFREGDEEQFGAAVKKGRIIFSAFQTQAFQLGFVMMVHTLLYRIAPENPGYSVRIDYLENVAKVVIAALNEYFADDGVLHKKWGGLVAKDRIDVFSPSGVGLRGLLRLSGISELNEKQWVFFRYALLEMILSKYCKEVLKREVEKKGQEFLANWRQGIEPVLEEVKKMRAGYIDKAIEKAVSTTEFEMEKMQLKAQLEAEGKSPEEIERHILEKEVGRKQETEDLAKRHLKASLGSIAEPTGL